MLNVKFCEMMVFFSATPRLFGYQDRDHTMDFKKKNIKTARFSELLNKMRL